MRHLLNSEYFPFGSQYYRAPSPRVEDWNEDMEHMASLGFNMVKLWVQWRWNHPEKDRFYFDDIDRLMDLADAKGLRVMLNTIVDVAPAWIYREYPDASMLTLDGRRIGPQTQAHRQIGGLGVCFNHSAAMEHLFRFLRATIERYRDHPALEIWNVGSEPELTSSMSELRLYADDARKMGDMLCYCDRCQARFKEWLEKKYGDIVRLNKAWNRNYLSFDDAEVPRSRGTFNDMVDWRMFFVHTLGENVRRRFEIAKEVDEGRHPLMCHHVFIQGFPVTSTASDPWNVGRFGDLHGFTQMDDAMMCDVLRSCARGKPILSAEMLMLFGYTLDLPEAITLNDIKRNIFVGIAANLKGFLFWQFRPETLGREAPTWGLTRLDGKETPWLRSFAQVNDVLQTNAGFLLDAKPRAADIAFLYSPENQIFAWMATGSEMTATDSLLGAHRALYEHNYTVDFIHPSEISSDLLASYRVIVVPFPYYLNEKICNALRQWVADGGTLIGEVYFGGWFVEEGRHHTTVPGYGMHEVFQVRQREAHPPADHLFTVYEGVVRGKHNPHVRPGLTGAGLNDGFVIGQTFDPSRAPWDDRKSPGLVEIVLKKALPGLPKNKTVYGSFVREITELEGAEVLAEYADGEPAITMASYGKGKAIWIGSYVALPYYRWEYPGNGALFAGLVEHAAGIEHPRVTGTGKVRVDILSDSKEYMVILRNLENEPVNSAIQVPQVSFSTLTEQFTGEVIKPAPAEDGVTIFATLYPGEVKVYRT